MSHKLLLHTADGIIAEDPGLGILLAYGNNLPADGTVGYATGCHWIKTNGNNLPTTIAINTGTRAASAFVSTFVATNVVQTLTNKTLTAPVINAGTGTSLAMTAGITSSGPTSGVGYATGAGGAVTQITNSSTAVSLNKVCGQITTVALTTAAGAEEIFTVNNTAVAATDVIVVNTTYNGAGAPAVSVKAVAANSFQVVITNLDGAAALNAACVINFAVIKGVAA